ncbi:exocyst complex component 7-like isoform X2 [Gigantopelta aegis]|uniref:exocyst complex component 7-like isoform X2 n=1 Tax=Gigantopelta aegis TaxID=1735272 RepID=UPI001B887D61|nr:exocyst complex component 7-like isoform X2 [Gigantopelta aegis]
MDDLAEIKLDIDRKLEREENNLFMLRESLKKSSTNTQNMLGILTSFESRLQRLEDTIVPVYKETENLRRRQENIDKTLQTMDVVLGYYHVAKDVEEVIKEGPASCDLDIYISYMDKLLKAIRYFTSTNPAGNEIEELNHIFDDGKCALQLEFRSLLNRHGRPVPPIVIMDQLQMDDEIPPAGLETDSFIMEHFSEKVVSQLRYISRWLVANGTSAEFCKSYHTSRMAILTRSLQGLKEHLKTSSASSGSKNFQGSASPALGINMRPTKENPVRKSMKKIGYKSLKKSASSLMKLPFEPGHKRRGSFTEIITEELIDVETDLYITMLTALLRLMQSESHLMSGIIPEKHQRMVFDNIVQQSLETVVSEGELLAMSARKNIGRHEFGAVLSIFPIVKHLRQIKPEFDLILEGCQAPTRAKLASLLSTLDSTGAKALEEFIDSVRQDPDKASNMPRDGTVHELTNHTIIFLQQLQDFAETAGAMLLMHGEQAAPSQDITFEKCRMKVADYMTRVLSALGLNLANKAETYSDPALKPIFILNNCNYILKSLKNSGLIHVLREWNPKVEEYYEIQIVEQKRIYSESWNKVLHFIMEVDKPISLQRTQGDVIKRKDGQHLGAEIEAVNKLSASSSHELVAKSVISKWKNFVQEKHAQDTCIPVIRVVDEDDIEAKREHIIQLKEKEKQNIKDKFTGFNKELEEIYRIQKGYAIPDPELRHSLIEDNKKYIILRYQIFLNKFKHLNFTKNPQKYIKYTEEQVGELLQKFFDVSA